MFLLIDKPKGMTSHDVVNVVRRKTGVKRVGHGGTLDPNATGLLIIGVGRENTKKLDNVAKGMKKTYEAEIILGEERETDDAEGKVTAKNEEIKPSKDDVMPVLEELIGRIEQVPPSFSAVKVRGEKAYDLARKGKSVRLDPRSVKIYRADLMNYDYPVLKVVFEVSSGTYIRALARDIGRALGCGAYLRNLRRTRIGGYSVEGAIGLEKYAKVV